MTLIDVWDLDTFDTELMEELRDRRQLLADYFATDRANYLEREASDHRGPIPSNPFAEAYYRFAEELMTVMNVRKIRAWHHTRMTDREVETALRVGLYPATLDTLQTCLANLIASEDLEAEDARRIFEASPFHDDCLGSRHGKFWMTSHPRRIDDSGVTSLLAHWGGESAYFSHTEGEILHKLSNLGAPRILEIAVPLRITPDAYSAAKAVISLYARSFGCSADWGGFDLYASTPLEPGAIVRVHSGGEPDFAVMARGYPGAFHDRFGDDG